MTTMGSVSTSALVAPQVAKASRTRRLLEGAIVPTRFQLAAPNIMNLVTVIVTPSSFFAGWLGATALRASRSPR
jgi:hypothetical protein